jgi:hypothetical protein
VHAELERQRAREVTRFVTIFFFFFTTL